MKRGVIIGALAAIIVLGIGAFWFLFIRDTAPEELSLEDAIESIASTTDAPPSEDADLPATTPPTTEAAAPASEGLDGSWTIDTANSIVGYRIGEELASIGTKEAVGRTSNLVGGLTLNGAVIETVSVEVDMASLESDSSRRDGALRTRGIETGTFPTATFSLTAPIDLGSVPGEGETITATATGDLTLHGVTRSVDIPIQGTLVEGTIVVVGSVDIELADYDIEKPTGFSVLSIEDVGVIEMQLAFVPS